EAFLQERPVEISREGDVITVRSRPEGKRPSPERRPKRTEGHYVVTIPKQFAVNLKTGAGPIDVQGLQGELKATTSGGNLKFIEVHGPIEGKTSGGSVQLEKCEGEIRVRTSGGNLSASGGGGSLDGKTSGGFVSVKGFQGPVDVVTIGGGIRVEDATGRLR